MDYAHVNYLICNESNIQPLAYAKVENNKYSFFSAPLEESGEIGEYEPLNDDKFDAEYSAWTTDGYSVEFIRKDKTWYMWKYYSKEYASSIPSDAYIFLDCVFEEVKEDSDESIKELYKRHRDGIPEQFLVIFDEWILEDTSIQ